MSFKETDFTGIISYLKRLVAKEQDPILFKAMVSKLVEIYDELPVYPGLVNMCIGQAKKTIEPKDLKKGQRVFISTDKGFVSGVITKTGKKITLKNVINATENKTTEVDFGEIKEVSTINDDVVKELWPSLVFDKEQNK